MKDLIIIGAGPAGLSAAIYGVRAGLDLLVIEKLSPGGQVVNTFEVENYPGFAEPVGGFDLVSAMEKQAKRLGAEIQSGEVREILKSSDDTFAIVLADGNRLQARSVIAATGSSFRKLGIPGEAEFTGRGVSYCATCDGAFFRDRVTAVIGGGDAALEEAMFLTRFSSTVYLIHRRDRFRGAKILQDRVLSNDRIVPVYNAVPVSINGDSGVESVTVRDVESGEDRNITIDGVFIFIGYSPNTGMLPAEVLNERGEAVVDLNMRTSLEGFFAAGDLRHNSIRQIVAAAADGAIAAMSAYQYLLKIQNREYGEFNP